MLLVEGYLPSTLIFSSADQLLHWHAPYDRDHLDSLAISHAIISFPAFESELEVLSSHSSVSLLLVIPSRLKSGKFCTPQSENVRTSWNYLFVIQTLGVIQ
uniref:Uncharacterized protein n=1 Tax=Rhizophora mucronata TaxID=61149 RepID=A0A2P2J8J9_RHIMU